MVVESIQPPKTNHILPSAAKPNPKGIEPRISRISRMKTLHSAFCLAIIRAIRAIRGKNLRETERLWHSAVHPESLWTD